MSVAKVVVIFVVFSVLLYVEHSSVGSLTKVDLYAEKFRRMALEDKVKYQQAINQSLQEFEDLKLKNVKTILAKLLRLRRDDLTFNKCCKEGESLNNHYNCEPYKKDRLIWQPPKHVKLEYKMAQRLNESKPYMVVKSGKFIDYLTDRARKGINMMQFIKNIPKDLYCVDDYQEKKSDYAVLLWSCGKSLCLQKCCPYGFYYNTDLLDCEPSTMFSNRNIRLALYRGAQELESTTDFFLIYSEKSNCKNLGKPFSSNSIGIQALMLQENGDLVQINKETMEVLWKSTKEYCVDIFSDNSVAMVNGFFCDQFRGRSFSDGDKPDFGKKGRNTGSYSLFNIVNLVFTLVIYVNLV